MSIKILKSSMFLRNEGDTVFLVHYLNIASEKWEHS